MRCLLFIIERCVSLFDILVRWLSSGCVMFMMLLLFRYERFMFISLVVSR